MAGGVRKLGVGDRVQIAAKDYNRWQDAGMAHAFARFNQNDGRLTPDAQEGIILVKNTTALSLPRFSILGLNGSVYDPNYSEQQRAEFKNQIALKGTMPSSTYAGKFCVLQNDALPGEVVPAMVSGVTPCLLKVGNTSDSYADVETDAAIADRTRYLKTGASGAAQILFKPADITGEQPGVVRLSNKAIVSQPKIIRHGWLPAAYGGPGTTGISGAAATSNGNISPTNRQIFPKLWTNAYSINSSGDLEANSETGYCVNLGSLPIHTGWSLAVKLPSTHPDFGDLWAILPDSPSHYGTADFTWDSEPNSGDWTYADGDKKLIRPGTGSTATSAVTTLWAFPWGGDVMLSHVGLYEVTFGYQGKVSTTTPPYYTITTSGASAGTAHTHTFDRPAGFSVEFGIHQNFQPGTSVIGTNPNANHLMRNHHISHSFAVESYEKTVLVKTETSPWHGQHHTRLSLYIDVLLDSGASSAGTPTFILDKAWLNVRPARGNSSSQSAATDFFGAGANQYPGGYNAGLGTFVWYGGGTEPDEIDEDGAVIP